MKQRFYYGAMILWGIALMLTCGPAWAQEPKSEGPGFCLTVGNASKADVAGSRGALSAIGYVLEASYKDFKLSYERINYSWYQVDQLPFGNGRDDPWQGLQVLKLGYTYNGQLSRQWMYFMGGSLSSSFEKQIHESSLGVRAYGAFIYVYSPEIQLILGAGGGYHKIKREGIPFVVLNYNAMAPDGFYFSMGFPLTQATYRFNPQWAARLRAVEYDTDLFQLSNDSPVEPEGYLERRDLMVGTFVDYSPIQNFTVSTGLQFYFDRELTIHKKDDDGKRYYGLDNTWGGVVK